MTSKWPAMLFGKKSGGGELNEEEQKRCDSTWKAYQQLEGLIDVSDSYTESPCDTMRKNLDDKMRHSNHSNTAEIFFGEIGQESCFLLGRNFAHERDLLVSWLIARSISKNPQHNFSSSTQEWQAQDCYHKFIDSDEGKALGEGLLGDDMYLRGFETFFINSSQWRESLELLLQDEVYILGTVVKQLTSQTSLPCKMKFFSLKQLGSTKTKIMEIADLWEKASSKAIVDPIRDFVFSENHLLFVREWLDTDPYLTQVQAACNVDDSYEHIVHHRGRDCHHCQHQYGLKVKDWINHIPHDAHLQHYTGELELIVDECPLDH